MATTTANVIPAESNPSFTNGNFNNFESQLFNSIDAARDFFANDNFANKSERIEVTAMFNTATNFNEFTDFFRQNILTNLQDGGSVKINFFFNFQDRFDFGKFFTNGFDQFFHSKSKIEALFFSTDTHNFNNSDFDFPFEFGSDFQFFVRQHCVK